jgi:hypothetical protein
MKHLFTLLLIFCGIAVFAQEDTLQYDSIPTSHSRRDFFLNAGFGYGVAHRGISTNGYSELVTCREACETPLNVPSAELNVGYHITNWWNVSVGLQYFQTGLRFSEEKTLSDTLPNEFSIGCDVYEAVNPRIGFVQYAFFDPRFVGVIQGYHPSSATLEVNLRYHYIGLPVKTSFTAVIRTSHFRDFGLFVSGSITPNYMIRQLYDVRFKNHDWEFVQQDSTGIPAQFIRRWNLSTSVSVGVTLLRTKNCEVSLEVNRQDQLLNLFNWRLFSQFDYEEKHRIGRAVLSVTYFL